MGAREDIEKVKKKVEKIEEESFAMGLLSDYKRQNKRLFIIILALIIGWFITGIYLVYILNNTGVIEESSTQKISDINTIENSNIANGDINGDN